MTTPSKDADNRGHLLVVEHAISGMEEATRREGGVWGLVTPTSEDGPRWAVQLEPGTASSAQYTLDHVLLGSSGHMRVLWAGSEVDMKPALL